MNNTFKKYCAQIAQFEPLSADEAHVLALAQAGDPSAIERVVQAHLKLVVHIVMQYRSPGIDEMDLVGEGNLAILRALQTFDADRGRFSNYAYWGIRGAIQKCIRETAFPTRIPSSQWKAFRKLRQCVREHAESEEDGASIDDVAARAGVSRDSAANLAPWCRAHMKINATTTEGQPLEQCISGTDALPWVQAEKVDQAAQIREALQVLDARRRRIVTGYLGIGQEPQSMVELATQEGVSREYIRKLYVESRDILRRKYRKWDAETVSSPNPQPPIEFRATGR